MKFKAAIFFFFLSTFVFAHLQSQTVLYTLCGKAGGNEMEFTVDEFKTCEKVLLPTFEGDKLISYALSFKLDGYASVEFKGGLIRENYRNWKQGAVFILEKVKIRHDGKIISAPSTIVKII